MNFGVLTVLCLFAGACAVARHPTVEIGTPAPRAATWDEVLAKPGVFRHEAILAARWEAPLSGLVNLDRPAASELRDGKVPIVLAVHLLVHPLRGAFIVDTGVPREIAAGEKGPLRGAVRLFARGLEPVRPLGTILDKAGAPLSGVLITHFHFDHVLGLPDVPPGTPIYAGPGELTERSALGAAMRPSVETALVGHSAVRSWPFATASVMEPLGPAVDVLGDGSLWAIHTPGHTVGSTSYLALTTQGPRLFVGDASHTWWGWENGVEPGNFTADHDLNAETLRRLRAFADANRDVRVFVGHELDGKGTGVDNMAYRE